MTRTPRVRGLLLTLAAVALVIMGYAQGWFSARGLEPDIVVITPTYDRPTRFADLVHLSSTLQVAAARYHAHVYWIIIEDAATVDAAIVRLLAQSGLRHHYVAQPTPKTTGEHRGLLQRNLALDFIRERQFAGPVYFADDDNALRPELLRELRRLPLDSYTIFPVGNTGHFGLEGPVVEPASSAGSVNITQWCCDFCRRRWNVDMGGIAFHSSLLDPVKNAPTSSAIAFSSLSEPGNLETDFVSALEQIGTFVLFRRLQDEVHIWHDHSVTFHREAFYDASWITQGVYQRRMRPGEQIVRGYAWAEPDLPSAIMLK